MLKLTLAMARDYLYSPVWASAPQAPMSTFATSHLVAVRRMTLASATFLESGHWDYALLTCYDELLRVVLCEGVSALSNFGWAERTLLLALGALEEHVPVTFMDLVRDLGWLLASLAQNIVAALLLGLLAYPLF